MPVVGVIAATICLFAVLYWWSEGAIEASDAVVLAAVFCGLLVGLFAAQTPVQFSIAFIPLLAAAAYAIHSWRHGGIRAYYKRLMEEYFAAIQADPRNLAARQFLAETFYSLGQLDRAVEEMQAAVDLGAGQECVYTLGKWTKEQRVRDLMVPVCRWCGTENAPGARACTRCGTDLPYESALGRWLMGGRTRRARFFLLLIAGAAVAAVSVLLLPFPYSVLPVLLLAMTLTGWWLVGSARR